MSDISRVPYIFDIIVFAKSYDPYSSKTPLSFFNFIQLLSFNLAMKLDISVIVYEYVFRNVAVKPYHSFNSTLDVV